MKVNSYNKYSRLKNAYIILAIQLLITFFVVKLIRDQPKYYYQIQRYIWIPIILSFVILFIIQLSDFSMITKLFFFTLFSICLGMLCIATSKYISDDIINSALKSTLGIFIVMSIVGFICFKLGINLSKLQFILLFGLIGLIIGTIFIQNKKHFKTLFIIGFIIFSLLIASDTYRMISSKYSDPVSDALSLYLNTINLFQQIIGLNTLK
jgi:FtsH-binding integral membrane protein